MPALWLTGGLTLTVLCAVAFGAGTLSVLFEVAHSSLVARPDYVAATSLVNGSRAMSFVAGPGAGGLLVQVFGAPFALLADAVTFVASALLLTRMRVSERPVPAEPPRGSGARFVMEHPVLRAILLATAEFGCALGVMLLDITAGSVQTAATPASRLAGFQRTVNYGIRPIGAMLGGALGALLGVRPALWIATVGALLGVVWAICSPVRTMHELPAENTEPMAAAP